MSSESHLTPEEIEILFDIARRAIEQALAGHVAWLPPLNNLPEALRQPGASFVTLYTNGELHGCIGSVEARRPLAQDIAHNAMSAALNDPRFPALRPEQLPVTAIELSILSPLQEVHYHDLDDLIRQLRPGVDGVLVERGWQRGLLLPQVWDKLPDPHEFLFQVALKAHAAIDIYTAPNTKVYTFQVHHYTQPPPST